MDATQSDGVSAADGLSPPVLASMTRVSKSFGVHRVLHAVDFDLRAGEVHVLAGENGAGKSTLIKILGGVHRPDEGELRVRGQTVRFRSPREAAAHGVALIHQELSLVPTISVGDNIFLGREPSSIGWLRRRRQRASAQKLLSRLGLNLDIARTVGSYAISVQQLIEIAKALSYRAQVIVMDEPTSALNEPEVDRLFATIGELKNSGCGVIYITHKLEEVYRIADRITVLRDGHRVATAGAHDMPPTALIRHMIGRELAAPPSRSIGPPQARPHASSATDGARPAVRLSAEKFVVHGRGRRARPLVDGVSFEVSSGEILGLAGLHGSGASDLLWGLFGAHGRRVCGAVCIDGEPYAPVSPRHAIRWGVALVTNERQRTELVLSMGVAANLTLASLPRVSPGGWILAGRELVLAHQAGSALRLRATCLRQSVATLSGGNQQKVVLGKWINTEPRVLLLDEPTRGVDVGAKQEIYALMDEWRRRGLAMLLITSEMPELLMMSDRVLVMHRGRVTACFDRHEATQERILHAAMGGD